MVFDQKIVQTLRKRMLLRVNESFKWTDEDKVELMTATGMNEFQLKHWAKNFRSRHATAEARLDNLSVEDPEEVNL